MALQAHVLADMAGGTEKGRRQGRPSWGTLDRPLPTADGQLVVTADDDDSFRRLSEVCGADPSAGPRTATERTLATRLRQAGARKWEERLCDGGVAAAAVCDDLASVPADPRLAGLFEPVGIGGLAPRTPWAFE
jgi:crotonobetainyl-CoA:carnitine CoA-transferase CaiB-like acyl-CoA transferase